VSAYGALIGAVTRHRGITACLVVSAADGIVVDGTAHVGVNTAAFAALTASLHRKAARAAGAAGFGDVSFLELEAEQGRVLAAGRDELVVVAVADARMNLGLVRMELLRAAGAL
jgi:predicted regulator of Ras-like GTPase activity (Roadblock/LC7/MglB family)